GEKINFYPDGTLVSMNMWGINPDFIEEVLEPGFEEFLKNIPEGNIKKEYLLPMVIGELVEKGEADVKILPTPDKWFGVTYQEDKYYVKDAFKDLVAKGIYPENIKD
ncbi:MAG: nucleotidyltransferase, partial [Clostridia bacterium]|nr:nucleotidyltransferase [Clostridia bacterium]